MTKPKAKAPTPEMLLAKRLYDRGQDLLGYLWEGKELIKQSKTPKKPKNLMSQSVVTYLTKNASAFGCNRSDVVGVLSAICNDNLSDYLNDCINNDEEDEEFIEGYNRDAEAGTFFADLDYENPEIALGVIMLHDAEESEYLDKNGIKEAYYPVNSKAWRLATEAEILGFIQNMTIRTLKNYIPIY